MKPVAGRSLPVTGFRWIWLFRGFDMVRIITLLISLILPAYICAEPELKPLKVVYSGDSFRVPVVPAVVGYLGGQAETLILKYSDEPGYRYIGFTIDRDIDMGGCDPRAFFQDLLRESEPLVCQSDSIRSLQIVFSGYEKGMWSNSGRDFYYFLNDSHPSFVFFVSRDGALVKVESDFLQASDFKRMIE